MTRSASPCFRPGARRRVLIVSASHGVPPTQPRPQRALELGRHLTEHGLLVDQIVLAEQPLDREEHARLHRIALASRELHVVPEPAARSRWRGWLEDLGARFDVLGGLRRRRCPRRFRAQLARRIADRDYDLVIVSGSRLSPAGALIQGRARVLLDLPRLDRVVASHHARWGRGDAVETWADDAPGGGGLETIDGVLVACAADGDELTRSGVRAPVHIVPPVADVPETSVGIGVARPPRLLLVGSETVENLDAIRWFRRKVLPRIQQRVPSCRLRLVGESGRHIEPGTDIDRLGRIDDVDREYREAALVVLPLRLGGCLRRRAVEGLAHAKALALTGPAAYGLDLVPGRDAVVARDGRELAEGIISVLTQDGRREAFERRAGEIARQRFAPRPALAPLIELLGPPSSDLAPAGPEPVEVVETCETP